MVDHRHKQKVKADYPLPMRIRERQQGRKLVEFQIAWVGMLSVRKEMYKTVLPMIAELAALRVTEMPHFRTQHFFQE